MPHGLVQNTAKKKTSWPSGQSIRHASAASRGRQSLPRPKWDRTAERGQHARTGFAPASQVPAKGRCSLRSPCQPGCWPRTWRRPRHHRQDRLALGKGRPTRCGTQRHADSPPAQDRLALANKRMSGGDRQPWPSSERAGRLHSSLRHWADRQSWNTRSRYGPGRCGSGGRRGR